MVEPVTLVIERSHGREHASIIYGPLPSWLTAKGTGRLVYAWRLDKGDAAFAEKPLAALFTYYLALKRAGKLPPSNLADPPRRSAGERGSLRGPEHWWKPSPLPRGQDWTP